VIFTIGLLAFFAGLYCLDDEGPVAVLATMAPDHIVGDLAVFILLRGIGDVGDVEHLQLVFVFLYPKGYDFDGYAQRHGIPQ